ncbi:DMT family transporter [Aestuariibius sp. 2305UL40-4]|uniref:DMT family transporter n=1 Tax=Aestuariibius violaceus TaxID=3234132 RepID=UPI00345EAD9A
MTSTVQPATPSLYRGVFLMIAAVTVFTVMSAFIKAAERIPPGEAVFFRSVFAMPVIFVWLWMQGDLKDGIRTADWRPHAVRGIAGTCAMGLGFAGLKYLPLPEVTALRFVTPVLLLIFAAIFLGERFRKVRLFAVLLGLAGVVIMTAPRFSAGGTGAELFGVCVTLASAGMAALAQTFVKAMAGKEKTAAIVFYFSLTAAGLSLLTLPFGWVLPMGWEWLFLIGAGLIGGCGQILLTSSYRFADAGVLAPFTYVSMLWALLIGYFVFLEVPTLPMILGSLLIIVAGVVIVWRERALGLRGTAEGKVQAKGHM